jgi:hypothetical protein
MLISTGKLVYNTGLSKAGVAQQAEQLICNQQVAGSSPITSSGGEVPERPKGADCKSVVSDFGGSNPPLSTIYLMPERLPPFGASCMWPPGFVDMPSGFCLTGHGR